MRPERPALALEPHPIAVRARRAAAMLSVSPRTLWSLTSPRYSIPCIRLANRLLLHSAKNLDATVRGRAGPEPPAPNESRPRAPATDQGTSAQRAAESKTSANPSAGPWPFAARSVGSAPLVRGPSPISNKGDGR